MPKLLGIKKTARKKRLRNAPMPKLLGTIVMARPERFELPTPWFVVPRSAFFATRSKNGFVRYQ